MKIFQLEKDKFSNEIKMSRLYKKTGSIVWIYDGKVGYQVYLEYQHNQSITEAMQKLLEISQKNKYCQKLIKKLDLKKVKTRKNHYIYR